MGMYDTIHFDKLRQCPECGEEIRTVQTKKFEKLLNDYQIGDCVGRAEESKITKEKLFCKKCSDHLEKYVYLTVERGILLGVTDTRKEAEKILRTANKEKLLILYHDLYKKYKEEQKTKRKYKNFLKQIQRWFRKEKHKKENLSRFEKLSFFSNHLLSAQSPLQAIENFLSYQELIDTLEDLEERRKTTLEIYWLEDLTKGEKGWSVDVLQDELNEKCKTNWIWTVLDENQAETDEMSMDRSPFWKLTTEEEFSKKVVKEIVGEWLKNRGFEFDIRVISPDEAKGSDCSKN